MHTLIKINGRTRDGHLVAQTVKKGEFSTVSSDSEHSVLVVGFYETILAL